MARWPDLRSLYFIPTRISARWEGMLDQYGVQAMGRGRGRGYERGIGPTGGAFSWAEVERMEGDGCQSPRRVKGT